MIIGIPLTYFLYSLSTDLTDPRASASRRHSRPEPSDYGLALILDEGIAGFSEPLVPKPGDEVTLTVETIDEWAVHGMWRPERLTVRPLPVLLDDGSELSWVPIDLETLNIILWEDQIKFYGKGPSVGHPRVWVKFRLPSEPELSRRRLGVHIEMEIVYPVQRGRRHFVNVRKSINRTIEFGLSDNDFDAYESWKAADARWAFLGKLLTKLGHALRWVSYGMMVMCALLFVLFLAGKA